MAERRMFARTIIGSDAFLDMPQSTQCLYFHLNMRADDDGFVNSPKSIMREVGCKDDDLKLLVVKKFIIPFSSGIVVIKHWRIHNYIQTDRYHETKYLDEKKDLIINDNKSYSSVSKMDTECIQNVSKMDTEISLGKASLDKANCAVSEKTAIVKKESDPLYQAVFQSFISKVGAFTNYPKEALAIKRIIKYCEQHAPRYADGDKIKLAELAITKYYELTQNGDRFWRGQPFTPSALSSPGLFDRVLVEIGQDKPEGGNNDIPF